LIHDKDTKEKKQEAPAQAVEAEDKKKKATPLDEFGDHMERFAVKTAESIRKVIDKALASRNTVLTIRVNDEANKMLNMLVEAGLFRSRSESAAFLIQEGIKIQRDLFSKVQNKFEKIEKLRAELQTLVTDEIQIEPPEEK
jgi:Arc/MetJ-type ribon-helix-helix transcriptional regulator